MSSATFAENEVRTARAFNRATTPCARHVLTTQTYTAPIAVCTDAVPAAEPAIPSPHG